MVLCGAIFLHRAICLGELSRERMGGCAQECYRADHLLEGALSGLLESKENPLTGAAREEVERDLAAVEGMDR